MKTVGILGGMGPQASIEFYRMLIELSIAVHGAKANADYPHILLSNLPVSDMISSQEDEEKSLEKVINEARALERAGADFLVISCNTMHLFLQRFQSAVSIPFLSMIESVEHRITKCGYSKVGLVGTVTTINSDLYSGPLREKGVEVLLPRKDKQQILADLIKKVISQSLNEHDRTVFRTIVNDMAEQGAQAIILGCTELPLILPPSDIHPIPLINSLLALAEDTCRNIYV